jgi:L-fuculose-phosphate aldolase
MEIDKKLEHRLRKEIIDTTRISVDYGLIRSSEGNISVRLPDDHYLITPSGIYKGRMKPKHLLIVNNEGKKVRGKRDLPPSSEIQLHLEAYRQREDVNAVFHAHPPYSTALTIAGIPFPTDVVPEVLVLLGEVPTAPYATPGTQELALTIREPIKHHKAILLQNHGSLTVGRTLEEALIALESMEHAAHLYYLAHNLGRVIPLAEENLKHLRETWYSRHIEQLADQVIESLRSKM